MRIQHNIPAMNAYRNYNSNVKSLQSNLQKLSSGYRINKAGDDAAGLAISEKMRAQITGLEVAQKNAKDGISLVQTAEGAMTEVHDMLNRMYELAEQSANGTYADEVDREQMQKEIESLRTEINRIADSTNFNGKKLLDGSLESGSEGRTIDGAAVDVPILSQAATNPFTEVGTKTVLHKDAVTEAKTEFTVNLENVKINNAQVNDEITMTIGSGANAVNLKLKVVADTASPADKSEIKASDAGDITKLTTAFKDLFDDSTVGANKEINGQTFTAKDNGDGSITFQQDNAPTTSAEVVDANLPVSITYSGQTTGQAKAKLEVTATYANGATAVTTPTWADGDTVTFAGTGLSVTATKNTTGWAVTGAPTGYTGTFDGSKLTLTADDDGSVGTSPFGTITAGGTNSGITNGGGTFNVTAGTPTWTDGSAGTAGVAGGEGAGTYSVKTTMNTQGKAPSPVQLASTTFDLKADLIKDGSTLTIGQNTYVFKVGADSTTAAATGQTLIDLSAYEADDGEDLIDAAGELLSQQDGTTFDIGYDKGTNVISVHEVDGQTAYKKGELESVSGFQELIYANKAGTTIPAGKSLVLQIGDTSDDYNKIQVDVKDMHADAMGVGDIDIGTQEGASEAMNAIQDAINYTSDVRGTLGAIQNRLDHTINNLSVAQENIQDAESTIRDVDVAEEMMAYTKNNILVQAAQAMLAQANQLPQGVLQLLG